MPALGAVLQAEQPIDVQRGKELMRKSQAGETLTPEEQAYLERVKQEIRKRTADADLQKSPRVVIVNGSLGIKSLDGKSVPVEIPRPATTVSVIHICGKQDKAVKFEGAQTPKNLFKSAPDCVRVFVKANGCAPSGKEIRDAEHAVTRTLYSGSKADVEMIVVDNCGRNWPTSQHGLNASQTLWEFFSKHPKPVR